MKLLTPKMKLKNNIHRSFLSLLFLLSSTISSLQAQTIRVNDILDTESSFSPEELISDVLVEGNCANISNISYRVNGNPTDTTTKSYGYFKRLPGSTFPFDEGIILTTGNAYSTTNGPSDLNNPSTGLSDFDLNQIIDPNTVFTDATVFEFDFTPISDPLSICSFFVDFVLNLLHSLAFEVSLFIFCIFGWCFDPPSNLFILNMLFSF